MQPKRVPALFARPLNVDRRTESPCLGVCRADKWVGVAGNLQGAGKLTGNRRRFAVVDPGARAASPDRTLYRPNSRRGRR